MTSYRLSRSDRDSVTLRQAYRIFGSEVTIQRAAIVSVTEDAGGYIISTVDGTRYEVPRPWSVSADNELKAALGLEG